MRKVTSAVFPDSVNNGPHARKVILPKPLILTDEGLETYLSSTL